MEVDTSHNYNNINTWLKIYHLDFYFSYINLELVAFKMRLSYFGLIKIDLNV